MKNLVNYQREKLSRRRNFGKADVSSINLLSEQSGSKRCSDEGHDVRNVSFSKLATEG